MANEDKWVMIERSFDAPLETIWNMWTDAELFKTWYGPNGMKIPVAEMDAVVGGKRKICMEMQRGDKTMQMWFCGDYKEVEPPTRLVYTESMCDAEGNIVSPQSMGMPEGHPEVTEIILELSEVSGKTHMKMIHVGVPKGSNGAGGWAQAMDKMAALISS
ncbi:MAG: SRPBCC family protein [Alphaproteobacteria bacterium]